jgi:hypothetical protein
MYPDELALKFHLAEESIALEVRKAGGVEERHDFDLSGGQGLGIDVEDFRTRTCNNACLFCFIDQLPPGVRPTLKVKDDDYRLSFLHGNYITLTNLPERELDRIIEQRLSPLYVSVHATEPTLRTHILGRRKVDDLDRKIRKLIDGGVRLHTQIVLMPGINDGANLEAAAEGEKMEWTSLYTDFAKTAKEEGYGCGQAQTMRLYGLRFKTRGSGFPRKMWPIFSMNSTVLRAKRHGRSPEPGWDFRSPKNS